MKNRRICRVMFFVAFALLTGCVVHSPEHIFLPVTLPETFNQGVSSDSALPVPDSWWHMFNDHALNEFITTAFIENPGLDQAFARLRQFDAIVRQSKALRMPFINVDGNAQRSRQLISGTGNTYNMSIAAGFEVDLWNKLKSRAYARELETKASLEDIRTVYLSLTSQIADLYYVMIEQKEQLTLTDKTVTSRTKTLELVERRFREGIVPAVDVYQARQNLAVARSKRPGFEAALANTSHALTTLIGQYPTIIPDHKLSRLPEAPDAFPEGIPSEILAKRPDIHAVKLRVMASDQEIGQAIANRFPSINLLAGYGKAGSNFGVRLDETIWNAAANMFLPVIDWGRRKAEVDQAQARFEELVSLYRQTVLKAFQEVEDALVNNRTSEETIALVNIEEAAASHALRLAIERYRDGLSDYLPVLTAQTFCFDVQSRLLSARRRLISNRISLVRALGGSWMDSEIGNRFKKNRTLETFEQ